MNILIPVPTWLDRVQGNAYWLQVGRRQGTRTDTAGIVVSGKDILTMGMALVAGGGLGYISASKVGIKRPIIGAAIGGVLGLGGLYLLTQSVPESGPVVQQ
jgi:hypothetical protein